MNIIKWIKRIFISLLIFFVVVGIILFFLARKEEPQKIIYGASFNTPYAKELGLNWKQVYDAVLDDLEVKHLRLAAHWTMVEPEKGKYNFTELDYQLARAKEKKVDVVLAVGRRLPRWPECHIPDWAKDEDWETQKSEIEAYLTKVVERYKDNSSIVYWQVENEPFLNVFANEHCGNLDKDFLDEEIALVKKLDPTRPILVTDSGNLGTWYGAFKRGDAFGTSVYVYFWNPDIGPFKTLLPAFVYRAKDNLMKLMFGNKPTLLIELSAEPWLLQPVTEVSIDTQLERMDLDKIKEIVSYAKNTRYEQQYLWGLEWWYWMKKEGHEEMWDYGKELFSTEAAKKSSSATDLPDSIPLKDVDLSDTQRKTLEKVGINPDTFVITEAMMNCAINAVGRERVDAILAGSQPGILETVKLAACAKQ